MSDLHNEYKTKLGLVRQKWNWNSYLKWK